MSLLNTNPKPLENTLQAVALPSYVLITPARNEVSLIGLTLKSMVAQTVRPLKWVIVSDGSTDGTDELVREYMAEHSWIELVRCPERADRQFAAKVHAFNEGYARVRHLDFDVIGNLDADISFEPDYFAFLMEKVAADPALGVIGTPFADAESLESYDYRFVNIEHVSGACQLFRRRCFEEIGGYVPMKGGGIDYRAVLTSRAKGWKTRTFTERICLHHRKMGTAQSGWLAAKLKLGSKDYVLGNHPLWEVFRSMYQMSKPPYLLGGFLMMCGYLSAAVKRTERLIPAELVKFQRAEQMQRLKRFFFGKRES